MENPTKRPRLSGSFTPQHSSTGASTASPSGEDIMAQPLGSALPPTHLDMKQPTTLTPMSDVKPSAHRINLNLQKGDSDDESDEESKETDANDLVMDDDESKAKGEDWHLNEPTARPEYIKEHLNRRISHYYKLNSTPPIRANPHPSQNLISLLNLTSITASVRRADDRGIKIEANKLRKSYEKQIKSLGIPGRNKSVKSENQWVGGQGIMMIPEEDWHNTFVHGKEIKRAFDPAVVKSACAVLPGRLPEKEEAKWNALLGLNDPLPKQSTKTTSRPSTVPSTTATTPNPLARPNRVTSKRSYQDASFSGYGEGFVDDELVDGTDDDGASVRSQKRRKKDEFARPSQLGVVTGRS